MLRPSKRLALGVEAVLDLACRDRNAPVQSQEIARRLRLSRRYLEQVMQQLARAGILQGVRGPRGGYRLARETSEITVADILKVLKQAGMVDPRDPGESEPSSQLMMGFWDAIEADVVSRLENVTIETLALRARHKNGVRKDAFSISELADNHVN